MKVEKIIGDWYDVNCYCFSNDSNECLIIDAGAKVEKMKDLVGNKKVVGILLTHGHFDHTLYLQDYIKTFSNNVYGNENIIQTLKDTTLNQGDGWYIEHELALQTLKGDGKLDIGNFEVEYFSCPGHAPCCECYKICEFLFGGDVLFNSGIGRIDLKGSDKQEMKNSLKKLSDIEFNILYSGHGAESTYERQKRNIAVFSRFLNR